MGMGDFTDAYDLFGSFFGGMGGYPCAYFYTFDALTTPVHQ